ncbi:acyl-homoserine-lactone synthase [Pollutimonas bauzanensis]
MSGLARYRHRVFVEKLGWDLACQGGLEYDQFDRPDTLYMGARRDDGDGGLVGTARLLPTHRPYLLGEVFPQLMGSSPLPEAADVWELSRFAAVDFQATGAGPMRQFSSPVAVTLLREVIALAASEGVQRLITVSPLGVERLLRRAGFLAHRAAPPVLVDGHPVFACWIEVQGACSD